MSSVQRSPSLTWLLHLSLAWGLLEPAYQRTPQRADKNEFEKCEKPTADSIWYGLLMGMTLFVYTDLSSVAR